MSTVLAERVSAVDTGAIGRTVADVLDRLRSDGPLDGEVIVFPDAHYPFHPSTGLVTNPAVVAAAVRALRRSAGAPSVRVGLAGSPTIEADRTGRYLGYDALSGELDVEVVDLDDVDRIDRTVRLDGRAVDLSIPAPVLDAAVLNVPTLRSTARTPGEPGVENLGRLARCEQPEKSRAALRLVDPPLTLLDGTYTYVGSPRASGFLLGCRDATALDRAAGSLLGVGAPPQGSLAELADDLPSLDRERPRVDGERLLGAGYRLYARVTGDVVPPQMLGDPDG